MATAKDGVNQGRQGGSPARQDSNPSRHGHGAPTGGPTVQLGQLPDTIFGESTDIHSTGLGGSAGAGPAAPADVTVQKGQLTDELGHTPDSVITHTGVSGTDGAHNANGGPDTVTYTDPWGVIGGVNRNVSVGAHIDGEGDWTQANDCGYSGGPTLPTLENNRPTSTGLGSGHISSHNHPDHGK
jgi:hypothetical protein